MTDYLTTISISALIVSISSFLIGLLILWFVIYTAVRAALRSHRDALAAERHRL